MNSDFPRIITFLRKERGLSQKQAAAELGVSQALLSHYERGIRECGLDFLVKTAEYYDVTTDYLLGRTVERGGSVPDENGEEAGSHINGSMINRINRKILGNSNALVFDLLAQLGSKRLTNAVSNYLMCAQYQVFRAIYNAEKSNSQSMFTLDRERYKGLISAAMTIHLEQAQEILEREGLALTLSPDVLAGYFDKAASSLFNLIQFSERGVRGFVNGGQ